MLKVTEFIDFQAMFLSAILSKRTGTTCKKYSWHASNMADDLSFQITYSSMLCGYKSMSRITNTILSPSIPNPQYKKYLNGRLTLTLIIPSHPSRCESWNDYQLCAQ